MRWCHRLVCWWRAENCSYELRPCDQRREKGRQASVLMLSFLIPIFTPGHSPSSGGGAASSPLKPAMHSPLPGWLVVFLVMGSLKVTVFLLLIASPCTPPRLVGCKPSARRGAAAELKRCINESCHPSTNELLIMLFTCCFTCCCGCVFVVVCFCL